MLGKNRLSSKLLLAVAPLVIALVGSLAYAASLRAELASTTADDAAGGTSAVSTGPFIGIAVAGVVLALGLVYLVGRSVTRRLVLVADRANEVATTQLPTLVNALSDPTGRTELPEVHPIYRAGSDEIGELADSFTRVQTTLVDIAGQQMEVLRRGVSDIFVTLARRNNSLVDRQLALLDQLEVDVEDPELLADYYQLDHLATRMRRNAESLLVLARAEYRRRSSKPIRIDTVVRAGISEIEDYQRVDIERLDRVLIHGTAAADVSHVLAEVLDNATSFSPPETRVVVTGTLTERGYELVVADNGIGLNDERIAELNELLRTPPVLGLAVESTLGMSVVSLLAEKHGMAAQIASNDGAGISLHVLLPNAMLVVKTDEDRVPESNVVADVPLPPPGLTERAVIVPDTTPDTGDRRRPTDVSVSAFNDVRLPDPTEAADSSVDLPSPIPSDLPASFDSPATPMSGDPGLAVGAVPDAPPAAPLPTRPVADEPAPDEPAPGALPTRRPGASAPAFADDHSPSVATAEPTRLGDALARLAQSVESVDREVDTAQSLPVSGRLGDAEPARPRLPATNSLGLPTRDPGANYQDVRDEQPVTTASTDPDVLRERLSAFSAATAQSDAGSPASDPQPEPAPSTEESTS